MLNELENDNSQNVEIENTDSSNSDETTETTQETEQVEGESKEEYTEREKQLYARLKKLESELKDKSKPKTETKKESTDDVVAARLEARGILHADDQAYVLKYAKVEGVHYLEALEDDFVKDALDRKKKARLSASAAPRGNNRAPGDMNEVASAVKRFDKDGSLPDNPALVAKVMKAIKNR